MRVELGESLPVVGNDPLTVVPDVGSAVVGRKLGTSVIRRDGLIDGS